MLFWGGLGFYTYYRIQEDTESRTDGTKSMSKPASIVLGSSLASVGLVLMVCSEMFYDRESRIELPQRM
jgi:hypothetical protein